MTPVDRHPLSSLAPVAVALAVVIIGAIVCAWLGRNAPVLLLVVVPIFVTIVAWLITLRESDDS